MFDIHHYSSFLIAILIFQLVPGAGTIAILNATARNGRRSGLAAVGGTLAGDFVFMVAAVAGLATVMSTKPLMFRLLQWLGAAYLVFIGVQLISTKTESSSANREAIPSSRKYFRQAFTVSITNPKVMLFFLSFFPLFLAPGASFATLLVMMFHVTLVSMAYQVALVLVGNKIANRLKTLPLARRLATRIAGVALVGFGIKLAINNR
jgi:leucine efflux protein